MVVKPCTSPDIVTTSVPQTSATPFLSSAKVGVLSRKSRKELLLSNESRCLCKPMPEVSAVEAFVPRVVMPSSAIVVEEESMRAQAVAIESRAQKSHE
jgi:hypothetical protein